MDIKENAAYLKGLFEGYELDENSKEAKIIGKMLELMGKMAERISDLEEECVELRDYVEEIDEDLGNVEEDFYVSDDEYDEEFEEDLDNDFDDSGYDELVCPSCGETICVEESVDIADVVCPCCKEKLGDVEISD